MNPRVHLALTLMLTLAHTAAGQQDWYPFVARSDPSAGEIGLQDWLSKPAGKDGRITRQTHQLLAGGQPIKLWGLNLCYGSCAPDKPLADRRAAFYPKYGINSVRLHKFADGAGWAGIQSASSAAEYDAAGLDRMDYQVAKFKEAGIYVKLSAHFGTVKAGPDDKREIPYLEEFGSFDGRKNRIAVPHSAIFYSPEIQSLHIRQMVNLLQHTNPYTGMTYAADPAVAVVEIVNEQSILFYTSAEPLKTSPTLRRQVATRFGDWLRAKYGSQTGLVKAWGEKALNSFAKEGFDGEHLDQRNILPVGNPWYWDPEQLAGSQSFQRQRLLDTLEFLYGLQREFYGRYVEAMRAAGYTGEILGSNWQAGRALSHFANLATDSEVGIIDRHNYFGGGKRGDRGAFNNAAMVARAGSGSLSSGLQQVLDRPFMLSEWIHCFPNEWGVEGPAIVGAYGMGLQGWDVSYMFQNGDAGEFSRALGGSTWDVTAPQILGIFPAVARQVLRGDVSESELQAVRSVHVPSLFAGKLGFDDQVEQGYDDKELDSSTVPARSLAVARSVVAFTPEWRDTPVFPLQPFVREGGLVSSTGQLRWQEGREGYFTIDTAATQAVVGFARGKTCELGEATIRLASPFAAVYVTAQGKSDTLARAGKVLVVAMARARNEGMEFNHAGDRLVAKGQAPVRLEPVRATISLRRQGAFRVTLLDHDGLRTDRTIPVENGTFQIDGAEDKTPYYLVEFP